MASKQKQTVDEAKAAETAWREKHGGKPVKPYCVYGKFANAHIDGSWPVDIFFNGFYCGVDYANTNCSIKRRAVKRKNKKFSS